MKNIVSKIAWATLYCIMAMLMLTATFYVCWLVFLYLIW